MNDINNFHLFDYQHKELFNEEGWRRALGDGTWRFLNVPREDEEIPFTHVPGEKGTLYIEYEKPNRRNPRGLAHYLAYTILARNVVEIFDPSGSIGPYAPTAEEKYRIERCFPRMRKTYFYSRIGCQHRHDSLCQTWTLGYLLGFRDELRTAAQDFNYWPEHELIVILNEIDRHFSSPAYRATTTQAIPARIWRYRYRKVRYLLSNYFTPNDVKVTARRLPGIFR